MQWPNVEPSSLTYSVICAKGTSRHRERSRCCCAGSTTSLGQWPPALGRAEPQAQQLQKCLFVCIWCLNSASPFLFHPIPVTQGHSVCVHSTRPAFSVQVASATPLQLLARLVCLCLCASNSGGCSSQTEGQVVFQSQSKAFNDYFFLFVFFPAVHDAE